MFASHLLPSAVAATHCGLAPERGAVAPGFAVSDCHGARIGDAGRIGRSALPLPSWIRNRFIALGEELQR